MPDSRESRVIVEFLRRTDYPLLTRIARRMGNHLCWNGVPEAHALLQRFSSDLRTAAGNVVDDNRPLARKSPLALTEGSKQQRLDALLDAVAEVYASVFGPDPIEYRAERGPAGCPRGVHVIDDEDIAQRRGVAIKLDAVTDPARPLALASRA